MGLGEKQEVEESNVSDMPILYSMTSQDIEKMVSAAVSAALKSCLPNKMPISEIAQQIPKFYGDDKINVEEWLHKIELLKQSFNLDDKTIILLCTNKFEGRVKQWYNTQPLLCTLSWIELKDKIKNTFSSEIDKIKLLEKMQNRKWKINEKVEDYFFDKLNMCNQLNLDISMTILYIIRGIYNTTLRLQLRAANYNTVEDLFKNLKMLTDELQLEDKKIDVRHVERKIEKHEKYEKYEKHKQNNIRCYNCNEIGHISTKCEKPRREKDTCFTCGSKEHFNANCPKRKFQNEKSENSVNYTKINESYTAMVNVTFGNNEILTLIDTGSILNLIREDFVKELNRKIESNIKILSSLGGTQIKSLGTVEMNFFVNNDSYSGTFHVVPASVMSQKVLLGDPFLKIASITIDSNGVTVSKNKPVIDEPISEILNIEVSDIEESELKFGDNLSQRDKNKIKELVEDYKKEMQEPEPTDDVLLKIELTENEDIPHVDCLSRYPVNLIEDSILENLKVSQQQDSEIVEIKNKLENGDTKLAKDYEIFNGLLFRKLDKNLLVVPRGMRKNIVREYHDNLAHVGKDKILFALRQYYWFKNMRKFVVQYIKHCLICIQHNSKDSKEGFLHIFDKGDTPFKFVHLDHLGPLSVTEKGNKHILVIVDSFSKFVFLRAVKNTDTKSVIMNLSQIFSIFGNPKILITDRGGCFTSEDFSRYCTDRKIKHVKIAISTPQGNGQCERYVKTVKGLISKTSNDKNWDDELEKLQFILNNTYQKSLRNTPSKILFGFEQDICEDEVLREIVKEVNDYPEIDFENLRKLASENIRRSQEYNKSRFDSKSKEGTKYEEGDFVFIRRPQVINRGKTIFEKKFKGPFVVKKVLENDRYLVEDILGFQQTQRFYSSICSPMNMKLWNPAEVEDDF